MVCFLEEKVVERLTENIVIIFMLLFVMKLILSTITVSEIYFLAVDSANK